MDIIVDFAEFLVGLILLVASLALIQAAILEPGYEQIKMHLDYTADKAVTFNNTLISNDSVHDQKTGRIPGVDPATGYNGNDSGLSRMYFRPEQMVMIPAVDTDDQNYGEGTNTRAVRVSPSFYARNPANSNDKFGLIPSRFNSEATLNYPVSYNANIDKQVAFNALNKTFTFFELKSLAKYPRTMFGPQVNGSEELYGGFAVTVDSTIHPTTGKKSNSVIFVTGRVTSK